MTYLQTESIVRLIRPTGLPSRHTAYHLAHLGEYLQRLVRLLRDGVQHWSMARQVRAWRIMTERARQRRALARLSDRELWDIGISRYEVEFLLRQSR
jgi:uncharacterized protein YjiS (DUF1127 family)